MKKQSDLSRLMGYAGKHRYFTYASWLLAAISALMALLPFIYSLSENNPPVLPGEVKDFSK